jgi:hypothetical protein
MLKQLLAATAALALAAPLAAQAQEVPTYATSAQADQQIQGRITGFDGGYNLAVLDDNGYTDNVALHDGTVINPTGLTLAPGMIVNILGYNEGSVFDANEVDTPYTIDNAVPYYAGHPWDYYGPTIGLSFFFGNTGWWHGPRFERGGFDRGVAFDRGSRVEGRPNNVIVNNFARPAQTRIAAPVFHAPDNSGFAGRTGFANRNGSANGNGFANRAVSPHFVPGAAPRVNNQVRETRSAPRSEVRSAPAERSRR